MRRQGNDVGLWRRKMGCTYMIGYLIMSQAPTIIYERAILNQIHSFVLSASAKR